MNSIFVFARLGIGARLLIAAGVVALVWLATFMVVS